MKDYLEKYKPNIDLFTPLQKKLEEKTGEDRAFEAWKLLLAAKRTHDVSFLMIGYLLKDIRDQRLYETLDYDNFKQFLESEELDFSREKAYMCIKTYEYYIEYLELDPERVGKMNISKLSMMVPVLKKIDDKTEAVKQIESLSGLRHGEFVRTIKERTNLDGKPTVYFSQELDKWIIQYYDNVSVLQDLGAFHDQR